MTEELNLTIQTPDPEPFTLAERAVKVAADLEVNDPVSMEIAASELRALRALASRIEDQRKALKAPILDAGRKVDALFKPALDGLKKAEQIIKGKLKAFQDETRRIAEESFKRRQEEEAERRRLLEEAQDLAKEEGGEWAQEIVEEIKSEPVDITPIPAPPKAEGIGTRETWRAEVFDIPALLAWIVDRMGEQPEVVFWVTPNMQVLNAIAREQKTDMCIPGIRPIRDETVVVR